jgi:hypothetical protein
MRTKTISREQSRKFQISRPIYFYIVTFSVYFPLANQSILYLHSVTLSKDMVPIDPQSLRFSNVDSQTAYKHNKQCQFNQKRACLTQRDMDLLFVGSWAKISQDQSQIPSRTTPANDNVPPNQPVGHSNQNSKIGTSSYSLQRWLQEKDSDPFSAYSSSKQ